MFYSTCTVFTEASNFAFGGYNWPLLMVSPFGVFFSADVHTSSTYLESKAAFYVLKSYAEKLRHQRVKVFVDNMRSSRILIVGSATPHLQEIAVDIFSIY